MRRKIQEAILSLWLERQAGKEEILLRYLNTAYFGAGAYGVDAAARRYFGKPTKDLSLGEAAMLAGLVRAPSQLAPTRNFGRREGAGRHRAAGHGRDRSDHGAAGGRRPGRAREPAHATRDAARHQLLRRHGGRRRAAPARRQPRAT